MPPPSAASFLTPPLLILLLLFSTTTPAALSHTCSTPPTSKTLCPPFTSPPPYPFSFSAGCGHPSFQLRCSSPSSAAITINNLTFSLRHYDPNSTSLTLSLLLPQPPPHHLRNCTPTTVTISALTRPISLSGSSFRVSNSSCSRLSVLTPCTPLILPNFARCPLECKLIKKPIRLIQGCGGASSTPHRAECQHDVLGHLDNILRLGFDVEWDQNQDPYFASCTSCKAKSGFCGFNSSHPQKPFICFHPSPPQTRIRQKSPNNVIVLFITSLFICFLIALSIGFVVFLTTKKALSPKQEDPTVIFLRRHRSASLLPPVFTYDELDTSTNHFDPKRKIGDGGFGSVYLGQLHDARLVAVKHLHKPTGGGTGKGFSNKSFCNEILILSSIYHPNLVKLHGYCSDPRGLLLVYDYVPNGTLADHLHGKKQGPYRTGPLSWNTRVDIAFQIAIAIEYLHFAVMPPIVHRDITSSNIFVERDMRVRVGDFGLSRLLTCSETPREARDSSDGVWTGPQGTPGYLDPDYYMSFRLNEKSDIYSFGVVLLELITGMRAVDQNREMREVTLADMVVPRIQMGLLDEVVDPALGAGAAEGVGAVAELAFRCVAADKDDRPDAHEVAGELRRIKGRGRGGGGGGRAGLGSTSNVVVPDGGCEM